MRVIGLLRGDQYHHPGGHAKPGRDRLGTSPEGEDILRFGVQGNSGKMTDSSMSVLSWLESQGFSVWVLESPSIWAQPTVLTLHTIGLAVLVGATWVLDLRLLGIGRNVPLSSFHWVFRAVSLGLIVNMVTGVLLFAARATKWGVAVPFLVKMALVVASAATVMPIRSYVLRSGAQTGEVSSHARLLAMASLLAWAAAVTAGRLLAYLVP
jgi:hypothetical protein